MAELPKEIYLEVFSYLPTRHLRSVSLTCRAFASLSKPLRFHTLHFDGDAQQDRYDYESFEQVKYPGRTKTVELGTLRTTVEEIIALDLARFVKMLVFSPVYYIEDFWRNYRAWVEEEIHVQHDDDFEFMHEVDDWEEDEEFSYVGMRRIDEKRRARPEKERDLVEAAEIVWTTKVQEQELNADANMSALVRFFENAPCLKGIEIKHWRVDLRLHGIEGRYDDVVSDQFNACETTWSHLNMLSSATQASGRRITNLVLPNIDPEIVTTDSSLESLFSALTMLSFDIEEIDFMLKNGKRMPTFNRLIGCTSQTLQKLMFRNYSATHPHMPKIGGHFLEALFETVSVNATTGTRTIPPIFASLKELQLRSIIVNTPSLIAFVSNQPVLQYAYFEFVYLATFGYEWSDVAEAMPTSCNRIYIKDCGHKKWPGGSESIIAYNQFAALRPYQEPFPPSSGWQTREAFFEEEMEKEKERQDAVFVGAICPENLRYGGRAKREWVEMWRKGSVNAEYERIRGNPRQ